MLKVYFSLFLEKIICGCMPSALARGLVQQALPLRLVLIDLSLFSFGLLVLIEGSVL